MISKIYFTIILLSLSSFSIAQNFTWANEITGASIEEPIASATDNNGNTIVVGKYTSPSMTIGNITLINSTDNQTAFEMFLAKYDAQGNILWAKTAGGTGHDEVRDMAIDDSGNIYVTGYFTEMATFENEVLETNENFTTQAFLVKYSPAGDLVWIKDSQSLQFDNYPSSLAVDGGGNIYVAGSGRLAELADINIFGLAHNDQGDYDGYVLKMDTDGDISWLKEFWYDDNAGTNRNLQIHEIAINADDSRFCISGIFWGVFDFGGTVETSKSFFVPNTQIYDIYTASYSADGDLIWVDSPGAYENGGPNDVHGVAFDGNNNTYLTGKLGSVLYFSNGDSIVVNDNSYNDTELFLLKYNSTGEMQWVEQVYVQENVRKIEPAALAVSDNGNIFLTGYYEWDPVFGNLEVPILQHGAFFAKYNTQGQVQWVKAETNNVGSEGIDIGIDAEQNVYASGYYTFAAMFDSFELANGNARGTFVVKISETPNSTFDHTLSSQWSVYPNPVSNSLYVECFFMVDENAILEIVNPLGQVVRTEKITGNSIYLNLSNLNSGTYFLRLQVDDVFTVKKIIKR